MEIIEAIRGRASTRAFKDKPVSKATVEQILEAARWAPSGVNTQPWQVSIVMADIKHKISDSIISAFRQGIEKNPDYQYYPTQWFEPYKTRRFACGMALYNALSIERDDKERRAEQWEANYRFFDAPVGLFFWLDNRMEKGSWLDMGMFLQNVMLAARGFGCETCPQAAMAEYPDIVRKLLGIGDQYHLVSGMALGYADYEAPVNNYRTDREAVSNFTQFYE